MTVAEAVAGAHRDGWALVLAATVRVVRDVDVAEECVQEAYAAALVAWPVDGIPANPVGWLTTAARRRAIDVVRRERVHRTKLALLTVPESEPLPEPMPVLDERLGLLFMCCHPALGPDVQPALTLRLVCGVSTADIARAFLVPEPTMAARLTRAKQKIAKARIPFRVPPAAARPGRYVLQAAIAALYAQAPTFEETDWPQLLTLYDELLRVWPSPVVALNRTVPLSRVHGCEHALRELETLERDVRLGGYQYLPAVRADLLERLGRRPEAAESYRRALALTANEPEREFLAARLAALA
ncbi:sigma factor-like helix-turn-helix DNA-binding protein [Dactylosporangium sp. NPDC000244]|uniref:RNA polymerase sigma factor n=1 Tax=Dactylosporangium sp. NPDC000244 TaxID=3154365 RepID=UPI00331B3023